MKAVLCIGGLDPAGRAGLLADARAVAALGARPLCVATALTFQSSLRVDGYEPVSAEVLEKQIAPLLRDEPVAVIKVGQLATPENAAYVATLALKYPVVLDTPLVSSSGAFLFPPRMAQSVYRPLVRLAELVTPNANEVFLLAGESPSSARAEAERAAAGLDAKAVLLKGGHIDGETVTDVLLRGEERMAFSSPRQAGRFRGTGCRLASAIAARLAAGDALEGAITAAREWLQGELHREANR